MLIIKGLIGGLFQLAIFSAFIIVPAGLVPGGTWLWDRALIFLVVYGLILETTIVVMAVKAPANLEARLKPPVNKEKQPIADRIITSIMMLIGLGWFVSIPIDFFYLKLLPAPLFIISISGGVFSILGFAIVVAAIFQNAFAVPTVEDQTEQGQTLVDTGLYGIVRHPLYLGILPFVAGLALWFGSYAATIAGVIIFLIFVIARIIVEEKSLKKTLPGYTEYMKKVRYRLIPFIW